MSTLAKWKPQTRAIMSTFGAKMSTFDDSDFGNVDSSSKESTFPRADPPWHFDQKSTMRTEVYSLTKCQENVTVMLTLGTQVLGSVHHTCYYFKILESSNLQGFHWRSPSS